MTTGYLRCIAIGFAACALFAQSEDPIAKVEAAARIPARMRQLHVPAVSIAVMQKGKIAWTKTYGAIDPDTIFQAASISKPVAATAALHMMQYGNFTLDEDVNGKLTSWKVPGAEKVTLRQLLSHSAGLTIHGFPGYAEGSPLPTLAQILDGVSPANTSSIRVDITPGMVWRYSGGGYTVLQQLMMDKIGWPFPQIMQRMVLGKFGMTRSTYEQPLPASWAGNAATGHDKAGKPVRGQWHQYPEMAAAGLWTTPTDIARWAIAIREAYHGRSNTVIEQKTARIMLSPQKKDWGLGPRLSGFGDSFTFQHSGSNEGFRCQMVMLLESGNGAVVMTNAENGLLLVREIVEQVAAAYSWPQGWDQ